MNIKRGGYKNLWYMNNEIFPASFSSIPYTGMIQLSEINTFYSRMMVWLMSLLVIPQILCGMNWMVEWLLEKGALQRIHFKMEAGSGLFLNS